MTVHLQWHDDEITVQS